MKYYIIVTCLKVRELLTLYHNQKVGELEVWQLVLLFGKHVMVLIFLFHFFICSVLDNCLSNYTVFFCLIILIVPLYVTLCRNKSSRGCS